MKRDYYKLWLDYHYGRINYGITKEEYLKIKSYEITMHLLVPTYKLIKLCGGYESMKEIWLANVYIRLVLISKLAKILQVPSELVLFKMEYIIDNDHISLEKNKKDLILKKVRNQTKNVVYVDF